MATKNNKDGEEIVRNVTANVPLELYHALMEIKMRSDREGKRVTLKDMFVESLVDYCSKKIKR